MRPTLGFDIQRRWRKDRARPRAHYVFQGLEATGTQCGLYSTKIDQSDGNGSRPQPPAKLTFVVGDVSVESDEKKTASMWWGDKKAGVV